MPRRSFPWIALALAGPAGAQAPATASIAVTATVQAALEVRAEAPLAFGTVLQGTGVVLDPTTGAAGAGQSFGLTKVEFGTAQVTVAVRSQNGDLLRNGDIAVAVAYRCAVLSAPTAEGGFSYPCTAASPTLTRGADPTDTRWLRIGGQIAAAATHVPPGVYRDVLTITLAIP